MVKIGLPSMYSKCYKVKKLIINDKFIQQQKMLNCLIVINFECFHEHEHRFITVNIFLKFACMFNVHLYIFTDSTV